MADNNFSLNSVEVQQPPLERFAQFLQSRGKRVTKQRRIIVEQVFSHHDHFDADELMAHLREAIERREVSRPTVYRTLSELTEAGLIRKMTLAGRSVYEHAYGYPRHDHLHCQVCNTLIEFQCEELDRISQTVARQHDFQISSHRMFVTGICANCRKAQKLG
ncbi:MAG: transcriptional repressor [Pirellulales bacterium]|nr:transcriptional repressor [Pirellulales bacterium]